MEGHAEMDMSVSEGNLWQKIFSARGFTAVSHLFVMDWASVIRDVVGGLLIAGALAAWVPETFWKVFFLSDEPRLAFFWGPLVGPIVSVASFVCSIGNVPLAAVLWNNGISFGGVISFIFADLIILPILSIKRKYYGTGVTVSLFATFYAAMALAGLLVFSHLFVRDIAGDVLKMALYGVTALVFVYAKPYLQERDLFKGEFHVLVLFAMLGMMNPKDATTTRAETVHHH